jgi:hypothetical protein
LVGGCYDNALIEAFWTRLQVELLDRSRWAVEWFLAIYMMCEPRKRISANRLKMLNVSY